MNLLPIAMRRALSHADYAQYIKGQIVFVLGFWLRTTALSWLIYSLTSSSFYIGLVASVSLLPALIFGPLSGILTDKIPKKNILLSTQVLNIITTSLMFALILLNCVEIWHVILASFLFGTAQGVGVPARNAFVIDLVGKEDIAGAVPVNVAVFNLGSLLGPALAGLLIPIIGEGGIFAMNIFGEAFAFYAINQIKTRGLPEPPVDGQKNTLLEGFKYAYDSKIIYYSLILLCVASIISSPIQVFLPIISTEILGGDSTLYGMLGATLGVGGFAGAVILGTRSKKGGLIYWLIAGNFMLTLFLFIFAFAETVIATLIILFILGLGLIMQHTSINTIVQFTAPHKYVGRVMALHSMCLRGMGMVGSFFAGLSGQYLGVKYTLMLSGSVLLLSSIFILPRLYREAKKINL